MIKDTKRTIALMKLYEKLTETEKETVLFLINFERNLKGKVGTDGNENYCS